jgi:hypothetical protein
MADLETVHATIDHTGITGVGGASLSNLFVGPFPWWADNDTTVNVPTNRAVAMKFMPLADITVSKARFRVVTQSGNVDVGIYDAGLSKLASTGSTACPAAGAAELALSASATLVAGTIYHAAFVCSSATAKFQTVKTAVGVGNLSGWQTVGRQESALPLPATLTIVGWEDTAFLPMVWFIA